MFVLDDFSGRTNDQSRQTALLFSLGVSAAKLQNNEDCCGGCGDISGFVALINFPAPLHLNLSVL
jgi:hypothetical protein